MFEIKIETGNAEMSAPAHVAVALRKVADKLDAGEDSGGIRDENGNTVGEFCFMDEHPQPSREERHLEELRAIGYEPDDLEPLWELELRGARCAEDQCNVEGYDPEPDERDIRHDVAMLFGGELPDGFFLNGDPRGYALKLDAGTGSITHRDWGDFEILAPDFSD